MTTIAIAEDHLLVREALKCILSCETDFQVVAQTSDGLAVIKLVDQFKPQILFLDLGLPNLHGLEVLKRLHPRNGTKTIVVSMQAAPGYVVESFRNGAAGYVLKDSSSQDLIEAIRTVVKGDVYISPSLKSSVINISFRSIRSNTDAHTLTTREREILGLCAEGQTSRTIGRALSLSRRTVEAHRTSFMKKLGLKTQTDLVRYAVRNKIICA